MEPMLSQRLDFIPERDAELLASVPAAPAVFLLRGTDRNSEPYVSKTANLRRRLIRLLGTPEGQTRRLNLRDRVEGIEYSATGSDFESRFLLYQLLRRTFPDSYARRLRLRFAPLIKVHMGNAYPRASITTRLGKLGKDSLYYGPFPSRTAAERFANDSLDFFKMRRCVEDLNPDPSFPGCIYSEMKMCLAPCFKGCTDDDYRAEVGRVAAYFDSGGNSLVRELEIERDRASANLEFEAAAALHARVDKVRAVILPLPGVVRRIDKLNAVVVQTSAERNSVALFRVQQGHIEDPTTFPLQLQAEDAAKSRSMESRLQETLASASRSPNCTALERMEHLAILKRWYYSGSRRGEIFFADDSGQLPMRRLVRGIARVFRGEKEEASEPATPATAEQVNILEEPQ